MSNLAVVVVLIWGAIMLIGGFFLGRADRQERLSRKDQPHER